MKALWQRAALAASSVAVLLALGACGRVENTDMPQPERANVEINRQAEPDAQRRAQQADAGPAPITSLMGAGSSDNLAGEDRRIAADVQQALAADPQLGPLKIEVQSQYGMVTLRGRAPDSQTRDKAAEVARTVGGVKSVDNMLTLG